MMERVQRKLDNGSDTIRFLSPLKFCYGIVQSEHQIIIVSLLVRCSHWTYRAVMSLRMTFNANIPIKAEKSLSG